MGADLSPFATWRLMDAPSKLAVDGMNILVGQLRFSKWGWRVAATNTLYKILGLLELGALPVFVYDGKPHRLKAKEWSRGELESALSVVVEGLRLMGLPCVQAPGEGEAQAAYMAATGAVDAVYTRDYDAFLFGSPLVVREAVGEAFEGCTLRCILEATGLNLWQLIDAAVLSGTDFNTGVKGVGMRRAVKLVRELGSLEAALDFLGVKEREKFLEARMVFVEPDVADVKVFFSAPQTVKLRKFLSEHLSEAHAENFVRRLLASRLRQARLVEE
ncbi:MAG: hypothetical protein QXN15_06890 [Candidatus Jordarchaeales archaeon]